MSFPPIPVYPLAIDSDRTLFKVYNTSEAKLASNNLAWSQEIEIVPVGEDEEEIWADNGFANISGELFYYDAVEKTEYDKVYKFKRCARNLGGTQTKHNEAGVWVRGFVIAEHHKQMVLAILNMENFVGINFSELRATLDWRIRNLAAEEPCEDDHTCPNVTFAFSVTEQGTNGCSGSIASYDLQIDGFFKNFRIDFGDGAFTTSELQGTHTYPPNSKVDPIVTVSNDKCQIVQSAIERDDPSEPKTPEEEDEFTVETIEFDPPVLEIPSFTIPETTLTLPQIVFPCELGIGPIGPLGPLNIPSIITVVPAIPPEINFGPIDFPSMIFFVDVPSFSPIGFGPAPSFSPIDFGPAPSFSPIEFGPAPSFSPIEFGPAPSFSPIEFGPAPSFSPIEFGPAPSFSPIGFGPIEIPSLIQIVGDIPTTISLIASIPLEIQIVGNINLPSQIEIIGDISIPSTISIVGDIPSIISIVHDIPSTISIVHNIPSTISIVGCDIPSIINLVHDIPSIINLVGALPSTITLIGSLPSTISIIWGTTPTISVDWGTPPVCSVVVTCPGGGAMAALNAKQTSFADDFNDSLLDVTLNSEDLGIPSEIKVTVPILPDINVVHNLPSELQVVVPVIPDIKIIGPDIPLPSKIEIVHDIPKQIEVVSELPTSILLDASSVPQAIHLIMPEDFKVSFVDYPSTIQVVGFPDSIEIKINMISEIIMKPPENYEIPLVYRGGPIPVQFEAKTPGAEDSKGPCFALTPC